MNKCVICGKDSGKGKTCGSTCRQALRRRKCDKEVSVTDVTVDDVTVAKKQDTPEFAIPNYGEANCECKMCRVNGNKHIINHGTYKPAKQLQSKELNRVTLPGDVDYEGAAVDAVPLTP